VLDVWHVCKSKNEEKGDLDLQHGTRSILEKSHVLSRVVSILLQLSSMNLSGSMISLSLEVRKGEKRLEKLITEVEIQGCLSERYKRILTVSTYG
jgi:hypothetical protein